MKLKQLSIFLENAPGRLHEVTSCLGEAGLNLRSLSICDLSGFGVLRILVSDIIKTRQVIMEKQLPARIDDVVAAEMEDIPGSLARMLCFIKDAQLNVSYMYAMAGIGSAPGKAVMIFRFSDNDLAIEILQANGIKVLDSESFGMIQEWI